jgi:hypothetical protein
VGVIILLVFFLVGVFKQTPTNFHMISFSVGGSTSTAVVTYTMRNGSTSDRFETAVPWHKVVKFSSGSVVILTAGNPTQTGSIECELSLDGEAWKKDVTNSPGDKASCAGIVP